MNPYDDLIDQDLQGSGEIRDQLRNPYDQMIDEDMNALHVRQNVSAVKASMTEAAKARRDRELAERAKLPTDIVAEAPEIVSQSLKAQDINNNLLLFTPEEREFLSSLDRLPAIQDDLPRLNALSKAIQSPEWYQQSAWEMWIENPMRGGMLRQVDKAQSARLELNIQQADLLQRMAEADASGIPIESWIQENAESLNKSNQYSDALVYANRGPEFRAKMLQDLRDSRPEYAQGLSVARQMQSDLPVDPDQPQGDDFWEMAGETIERPGFILRETLKTLIGSGDSLVIGAMTGGYGPVMRGALAGGVSMSSERQMRLLDVLAEEGYDLQDPDTIIAAFTDPVAMEKAVESASRKAFGTGGVDAVLAATAGLNLIPKTFRGRQLTGGQRELANQIAQVPVQGLGEGLGEGVGQYYDTGSVDMAEVAMETIIGGATGPVEVFAYSAGRYRQAARDRKFLGAMNEMVAELQQGNASKDDIRGLVALAKKNGQVQDVFINAADLRDALDQSGLDPVSIMDQMPEEVRQQYEQQLEIGGDVVIPLEYYASVLAETVAAEQIANMSRTVADGINVTEGQKWVDEQARPMIERFINFDPAQEAAPIDEIAKDLTGQMVSVGYDPNVADVEAQRMATMFGRVAAMAGMDVKTLYEQVGLQIRREPTEAQRRRRATSQLDEMLDRLRGGDIPQERDIFGPSLLDFIREAGGIVDEGGELAALDANVGTRVRRRDGQILPTRNSPIARSIEEGARLPDDMAEAAWEAGYIAERDPNLLMARIADELRGNPVFAMGSENAEMQNLAADLAQIDEELRRIGLDIGTMTNDEIIAELQRIASEPAGEQLEQVRDQTETPEFKRWFGDSKVVDANGKPLVVYHGSAAPITGSPVIGLSDNPLAGFSVTKDRSVAEYYGVNVSELYVRAEKIFDYTGDWDSQLTETQQSELLSSSSPEIMTEKLIEFGYDSAYFVENDEIRVFSPEQIKSATGNRGTFDDSGNILNQDIDDYQGPPRSYEELIYDEVLERRREEFAATGIQATEEQLRKIAAMAQPRMDEVTGAYAREARRVVLTEAMRAVRMGIPSVYISMDLANLGGLNQAGGTSGVDQFIFRPLVDIVRRELQGTGAQVSLIRQGGDEVSAVVIGADLAIAQAAIEKARQAYQTEVVDTLLTAQDIPVSMLPNPKGGPEGTDLYNVAADVPATGNVDSYMGEVDDMVELEKKRRKGIIDEEAGPVGFKRATAERVAERKRELQAKNDAAAAGERRGRGAGGQDQAGSDAPGPAGSGGSAGLSEAAQRLLDGALSARADREQLEQAGVLPEANRLSAVHNLSEDNLIFADRMGGIAVPSVAVVSESGAIDGFGEITLIGRRELVDPELEPVFDADAYTQRFPTPEYGKVKSKVADEFTNKIEPWAKKFDDRSTVYQVFDYMVNTPDAGRVIDLMLRSNAVKAQYLSSIGIDVEPVTSDADAYSDHTWSRDKEFMSWAKENGDIAGLSPTEDLGRYEEFSRQVFAAIDRHYKRINRPQLVDTITKSISGSNGLVALGKVPSIARAVNDFGKKEVDRYATKDALDKELQRREMDFKSWVEDSVLPLFPEPKIKVGGKKVPYTLENIVAHMTAAKSVKGKEQTMTFGGGAARAMASKQFPDLETMREAAAEGLRSPDEVEAARKDAEEALDKYRDKISGYYKWKNGRGEIDIWGSMDASMRAVAKVAAKRKYTTAALRAALRAEDFIVDSITDADLQLGIDAARKMMLAPVPYFEAKPQRSVAISEFAGAVIPLSASDKTREILRKNGVPFVEYNNEARRAEAVVKLRAELSERGENVLFQESAPVDQTETPEFKRWFGDSKVVDAEGKPLVVYHGTKGSFDSFDPLATGSATDSGWYGSGFYFTPNPNTASVYAANRDDLALGFEGISEDSPDAGANVMPVYLRIENPYMWRDHNISGLTQNNASASMAKRAELEAMGHDGVMVLRDFIQLKDDEYLTDNQWELLSFASPALKFIGRDKITEQFRKREYSYRELELSYGVDAAQAMRESTSRQELMEVVAFRDNQIKSAIGNRGTFDDSGNILEQSLFGDAKQIAGEGDVAGLETGVPVKFKFRHNPKSATGIFGLPETGDPFGRDVEPSGRYVTVRSWDSQPDSSGGMVEGEIGFINPIVIDNNDLQWKRELSEKYGGKTGKQLSLAIIADGHDGVITIERGRRQDYISEVLDLTTFDEAKALYQQRQQQSGARGSFFYDAMGKAVIQLGQASDLTTLPHESYHLFLDVMASLRDTSTELAGELDTVRKWLSGNVADLRRDAIAYAKKAKADQVVAEIEAMTDEQLKEFYAGRDLSLATLPAAGADRYLSVAGLEYFARAGEAYLLEGKAPSAETAGMFRRLKQWFLMVYRTAKDLKVNLSPEIRGLFNRMLATEEQIAQAQELAGYGTSLAEVEGIQWTDQERELIARLTGQARDEAERQLMVEQLRDMKKQQQGWWAEEAEKVRNEVLADLNRDPAYQARQMLTAGKRGDGSALPAGVEPIKLNKKALVDEFGEEYMKRLPSPRNSDNRAPGYVYSAEGGVDPKIVARMYGFDSVRALVEALINSRPVKPYVDGLVNSEMRTRYPDINLSGEAAQIAREKVQNDKQAELMLAELKKLEQVQGKSVTPVQLYKEKARQIVAGLKIRHLSPATHRANAEKYQKLATREAVAGKLAEALEAKQKALIHHYVYREALRAEQEADRVYKLAKRLGGKSAQETIGKAGADYLERINEILDRYEFRRISARQLERRESMREWMKSKQDAGDYVDIPDEVLDRVQRVNYRDVTIDELTAVRDAVKNLEHVARFKSKLLTDKRQRDLQEVVDSVVTRLGQTQKKKKGPGFLEQKKWANDMMEIGSGYAAIALNMDSIISQLDGFDDLGPVYDALKRPIDEAARTRLPAMQQEYGDKVAAIFNKHFSRKEQRAMLEGYVNIPGRKMATREQALAIALNVGNEYNRLALTEGVASGFDQLTEADIKAVLDGLSKADWDFVQDVWDLLDHDLWPQVKEAQKRRTGVAPEKVEAEPVVTRFGVYRGGYYPVKFDRKLGWRVTAQEAEQMAQEVRMGQFAKASTKRGHTKERTNTAQQPLKLDLSVLHGHVNQVITDLALGDAVNDVARVVAHKDFVSAMEASGNQWALNALELWLKDTAAQEVVATDVASRFGRRVRTGFTISKLAWNLGTILLQPTGLAQSVPDVGYKNLARAMARVIRSDWTGEDNIVAQVRARSKFMATRGASFNKDIQMTLNAMKDSGWIESLLERTPWIKNIADGAGPQKASELIKNSMMGGIVAIQQVVDTVVWLGAYEKGKAQFDNDADAMQYADNMVARTQASGLFSDRTAFERGTLGTNTRQAEFVRMWTVLGSYMFAKANIAYQQTRNTNMRDPKEVLKWMHDMSMLFVFEAIFIGIIRNTLPGEDDEDETVAGFIAKEATNSLLAGMPLMRDLGSVLNGFQGGGALGGFWDTVGKAGVQISQGEIDPALLKSLNNVGGIIFRYPSGQMNRTAEALWRDMNGEDVKAMDYLIWRQD